MNPIKNKQLIDEANLITPLIIGGEDPSVANKRDHVKGVSKI